jgi:tetratricopeptide (TPR) repeat protein
MVSCIFVFYCVAAGAGAPALGAQATGISAQPPAGTIDPDELYRHRDDMELARQAAEIYTARAAAGRDFEAAWKLARACYWLGTAGPDKTRKNWLDRGTKAGEQAARLDPARPEGHFWLAANLGEVAQRASIFTSWKYPGRIKEALQRVFAIDPAWQEGSADRALGEWYFKVPGLAGGDHKQAEDHLRASLRYNARSTASLFFLAEVVADDGKRKAEARVLLQQAIDAPLDPEWAPEDRQFKAQAAALLARLNKK